MRFEHIVEINSPSPHLEVVVPSFSREQLWRGLMLRVNDPQRFPMGPERCDSDEVEPGLFRRTLYFGQHVLHDEVLISPLQKLVFTPQAHGELAAIQLTLTVEEPAPGVMLLRFVYEPLTEPSAEELYFKDYRHNAWLAHDRDMVRTLRQWLLEGGLCEDEPLN